MTASAKSGIHRPRRVLIATILVLATALALVPVVGDQSLLAAPSRGFKYIGQLTMRQAGNGEANFDGALLLDPIHRRGYAFDQQGTDTFFSVYDLDRFTGEQMVQLPRIKITSAQVGATGTSPTTAGSEPITAIDPVRGRIFFPSLGNVFEVETLTYNVQTGAPVVHAWIGGPTLEELDTATGQQGLGTVAGAANLVLTVRGMSYDPGTGQGGHPERLFLAHEAPDGAEANEQGVVVSAWDARPGVGNFQNPEDRREWLYVFRSCADTGVRPSLATSGMQIQTPVFRLGEWLYTYCDATSDANTQGLARVHLEPAEAGGRPEPNPNTEEFLPGVNGADPHVNWDPVTKRAYTVSTAKAGVRSALVLDDNVGDEGGGAGQGIAAYVGEVALSQSEEETGEALDPGTGRWFFRTVDGLWYQDGRLRRVAQANLFKRDTSGETLGATSESPMSWRRIYVDPATSTRGARVFVWRSRTDKDEKGNLQCPEANAYGCYEIYEDLSPQPGVAPPPDERTLNTPEAEGRVGVYSAVTSAYGLRVRLMRGYSSLWPSGNVFLPIDNPQPTPPTPQQPPSYVTDPFFVHGGNCGSRDRELTFGRVLQTQMEGGLFSKNGSAVALAVDPDVHRPSAKDETQTRYDWNNPDECMERLLRTYGGQNVGQANDTVNPATDSWPYRTTTCTGDQQPPLVQGSLNSSTAASGPIPGTAQVKCAATASAPTVEATTNVKFAPLGAIVTAGTADTHTIMVRTPGGGIRTEAESIVRGVTVGTPPLVTLDEVRVKVVAEAKGYATAEGTTARTIVEREFRGLSIGGVPQCGQELADEGPGPLCDVQEVVAAFNQALGGLGYARAADPEADITQGTVKGTLAVAQKDLLLQDADATTNRDFSGEFPGLEVVIYRDSAQRGRGRWSIQLAGAFAQAQFGVINELTPLVLDDPPLLDLDLSLPPDLDRPPLVLPAALKRLPSVAPPVEPTVATTLRTPAEPSIIKRIRDGLVRNFGAALLLAALWTLVYGPIYVARRRSLLKQVASS